MPNQRNLSGPIMGHSEAKLRALVNHAFIIAKDVDKAHIICTCDTHAVPVVHELDCIVFDAYFAIVRIDQLNKEMVVMNSQYRHGEALNQEVSVESVEELSQTPRYPLLFDIEIKK